LARRHISHRRASSPPSTSPGPRRGRAASRGRAAGAGTQLAAILDASPDPGLVEELFTRSHGNAFFAEELLAASGAGAGQPIPDSLRDALTLRVERLSPQARRMVRPAAVAGSVLGHRLLAATSEMNEEELLEALHEAIEANVLVQDPASESYAFRHELLRE